MIEIKYSYICGSQLNEINGNKGHDKFLPHTLGHEASGVVLKIGKKVKNVDFRPSNRKYNDGAVGQDEKEQFDQLAKEQNELSKKLSYAIRT